MPILRIATRKSPLAQAQAHAIGQHFCKEHPDYSYTLIPIMTEADQHTQPLSHHGGKGVFVKAIQHAVLCNQADITVHSAKDMPSIDTPGLTLACTPKRCTPNDVLIAHRPFDQLPQHACIGTSSPRRAGLLQTHYPHLTIHPLRGNINTRIQAFKSGTCDGLLLAQAGLIRLQLEGLIQEILNTDKFIPAAGQGILAIECRTDDTALFERLQRLNHTLTYAQLTAERRCMRDLGGHCHAAIGIYAKPQSDQKLTLSAWIGHGPALTAHQTLPDTQAEQLGADIAQRLNDQGAQKRLLKRLDH